MDVPYGQMPIKFLNMVKIHGFTWATILKSMVLDHKIFCLVFYVFKNYEKMMLHLSNLLPQSHIAQSYISTNKQTLSPTQLEPPTHTYLQL